MAKKLTDKQKGMLGSATTGLSSGIGLGTSLAQIDDTSGQESLIEGVGSTQFSTGNYDSLMGSFDATNMARTNYTADEVRGFTDAQLAGNILASTATGALSGATKGGWVGSLIEGGSNLIGGTVGALIGNRKAQDKAEKLNHLAEENNRIYLNNFANAVSNTQNKMFNNSLLNIAAYGGPLFNHGGDWSNGLTFINEGGTHEQNPLGGVPVGVDQEGIPNLVEEGEVIWNDYVFSNRLKPTNKQLETTGFDPKYEGYTFAKIVEDVQKASAENPLDKISTDTLNENLMYLMTMQEEIRMKKEAKKNSKNMFPFGGDLDYIEEVITDESPEDFDFFWGAAKTPEQRVAIMDLDPTNAYKKPQEKSTNPFINAGTIAPLISSAGQLIYNTLKPIDKSNVIAAKAYSKVPMMSLPKVGGKKSFTPTDKNRYINPIIAQGNSTARTLQNQDIDPRGALLVNNYNTQRAIAEALNAIDQADFAKEMQVGQFNLGIDQANLNASQAEQSANILNAKDLARAEIADASTIEGLNALKGNAINTSSNTLTKSIADFATQNINWNLIKDNPAYVDAIKHVYGNQAKCGGMLTRKKRRK